MEAETVLGRPRTKCYFHYSGSFRNGVKNDPVKWKHSISVSEDIEIQLYVI